MAVVLVTGCGRCGRAFEFDTSVPPPDLPICPHCALVMNARIDQQVREGAGREKGVYSSVAGDVTARGEDGA